MELIVGNRAFSTWSLRPWLALKRCRAEFTVREIPIYGPDKSQLARLSPSGKVPLLIVDGQTIWDSLAISVFCSERFPEVALWPVDAHARWLARSVTCEMHSGFPALRSRCAMGPDDAGVLHTMVGPDRAPTPTTDGAGGEALAAELRRLVDIFCQMRTRFGSGGPYLFGDWSIPDAFFTPVAARVRHYQIDLAAHGDTDGVAAAYVAALLSQPDFLTWTAEAQSEHGHD